MMLTLGPAQQSHYLYNSSPKQGKSQTSDGSLPFTPGQTIETHVPKSIAAIQAIAILTFAYFSSSNPALVYGAVFFRQIFIMANCKKPDSLANTIKQAALVALTFFSEKWNYPYVPGAAIASYAFYYAYSQTIAQDPLLDAFHKIAGGKKAFKKLPLQEDMKNLNWEDLPPLSRGKTEDGRQILIVKAKPREKPETQKTFVFIEKANSRDRMPEFEELSPKYSYLLQDLIQAFFGVKATKETYTLETTENGQTIFRKQEEVSSTMSSDLANDFAAQL